MVDVSAPLRFGEAIAPVPFAALRRRAIFECCKWDVQVGDVSTLSPRPLLLAEEAWREIAASAEALAAETLAAERELAARPDLWKTLALDRALRGALAGCDRDPPEGLARLMRFDFHWTAEGWRISEVNSDVPGGFVEGSGFSRLVAAETGDALCGDPVADYAAAIAARVGPGATVALVHATAYSDDRQVMVFLEKKLADAGLTGVLVAPTQLRWDDAGRASVDAEWFRGPCDAIVRFYPAEWLPNCERRCGWTRFFRGGRTPASNPATALLTQSKRFPLVWSELRTPLDEWRRRLPETRDPRDVPWERDASWVVKPAFGRVGEDVGIREARTEKEWAVIAKAARKHAPGWVAQRTFGAEPVDGEYPCLGVFTVGGKVSGVYGRMARRAIVDHASQDVAVLIDGRHAERRAG